MPEPLTSAKPEKVYANVFQVTIPKSILVFDLQKKLSVEEIKKLREKWGFVKVSPLRLIAYDMPPISVPINESSYTPEYAWDSYREIEGRYTINVIKELTRRCLDVACASAGLKLCDDRNYYYFPIVSDAKTFVSFKHVDGTKSRVTMNGRDKKVGGRVHLSFIINLALYFELA